MGWFAVGIFSYFGFKARGRSGTVALMVLAAGGLAAFGLVTRSPGAVLWSGIMLWLVDCVPAPLKRAVALALANRFAMTLGNISYSTYVVHMLVIYLSMAALGSLHLTTTVYAALLIAMTLAGTAALSFLGYFFIEKPGIDFGAQLARGRSLSLLAR